MDVPQAATILSAYEEARSLLIGKSVALWLDELHGLRISIREHEGKWPVSTIRFSETPQVGSRVS